jgi:hypothetical protein
MIIKWLNLELTEATVERKGLWAHVKVIDLTPEKEYRVDGWGHVSTGTPISLWVSFCLNRSAAKLRRRWAREKRAKDAEKEWIRVIPKARVVKYG